MLWISKSTVLMRRFFEHLKLMLEFTDKNKFFFVLFFQTYAVALYLVLLDISASTMGLCGKDRNIMSIKV